MYICTMPVSDKGCERFLQTTKSLMHTALETNLLELLSFLYRCRTASEESIQEEAKLFNLFQALKYLKTCFETCCVK